MKLNQSLYCKFLYSYVFGPLGVDFESPKSTGFKKKSISLVMSAITSNAFLGNMCYRFIKPLRKGLTTIHQKASPRRTQPNPCGFDKCLPLFKQHFYQKFASESNTIKRIKQTNSIHGYGADPGSYFTDAVAILILNEFSKK